MNPYDRLILQNKAWSEEVRTTDPELFKRLEKQQKAKFLWIGCSDSRVPADKLTGTDPGEIFVHRNIANMVVHTDLNLLSVLQYAVEVLEVEHIIVCGHYGCGGVKSALTNHGYGLLNKWLQNIREVYKMYRDELDAIDNPEARTNRLVELNVLEQCQDLIKTSIVQQAWNKRKAPAIHGWVYHISDGVVHELCSIDADPDNIDPLFRYDKPQMF